MVRCGCFPCFSIKTSARTSSTALEPATENSVFGKPQQEHLNAYFKESELVVLGELANRVRVVIDRSLPSTLHGTSRVSNGVPLAIINPRAPDKRYVILHELMHHQLDELGCPSLCCTLQARQIPESSWLRRTHFQVTFFSSGACMWSWFLQRQLAMCFRCAALS
jgi:hypothetical protein